jgi:hypothetical protein
MPILGIMASSMTASMLGDYQSIATVTVTSATQASIEFTSIPATYTHLQIRGIARTTVNGNITIRFGNGSVDTGANYNWHNLYGTGSSAAAGGEANSSLMYAASIVSTANIFGATIIDVLDYANTNKYKTLRALDGYDANGSGVVDLASGAWRNTSAVNIIELKCAGDFQQYSSFALYGIKG